MRIPNDVSSLQDLTANIPQKKIARIVSAALLVYVAYLLAVITWQIFTEHSQQVTVSNYSGNSAVKVANDVKIDKVVALKLFGNTEQKQIAKPVQVKDAPQTKLRLTLNGTVASDDINTAAAIIENNGKQETYGIGDKITGTRAVLESVSTDRVLIKQSGRVETLMLDGFKYKKTNTRRPNNTNKPKDKPVLEVSNTIDQRSNVVLSQSAKKMKDRINQDPGKIMDYLKITPKRIGGNIIGYQLMPGKDPIFFKTSGLKSGDVAIQMNGLDLTIPSEAAQAIQALKQESEISLLVNRKGAMTEILFSIQ